MEWNKFGLGGQLFDTLIYEETIGSIIIGKWRFEKLWIEFEEL